MLSTINSLLPGRTYQVVQEFTDYEQQTHSVGEIWTFVESNFAPYDDGLLLRIIQEGKPTYFRMQWRSESQEEVMAHFSRYVQEIT